MEFVVDGQGLRELVALGYAEFNLANDLVSAFVRARFTREQDRRLPGRAVPPGPPRDVLAYDVANDSWSNAGEAFSRSTVPTVQWNNLLVIPNGETRPGYRTPEVWATPTRAGSGAG